MEVRNILNRLKWHPDESLEEVEIKIIHRGEKGDSKIIMGRDIEKLERSFLVTNDGTWIPYHRVIEIRRENEILWKKEI
ncbi:MAG: DUF504 domain-containing protein [Candidatus Hydrothermarchaeota archaeon]